MDELDPWETCLATARSGFLKLAFGLEARAYHAMGRAAGSGFPLPPHALSCRQNHPTSQRAVIARGHQEAQRRLLLDGAEGNAYLALLLGGGWGLRSHDGLALPPSEQSREATERDAAATLPPSNTKVPQPIWVFIMARSVP